jgi:hypothetical protein
MTAVPFAIAMTAVQPAASVSRVGTTSGGLEISGSVAVQTEEGLSFGGVRKGTERAAFPAVAGMPDTRYKESSGTAREISPSALARFSPLSLCSAEPYAAISQKDAAAVDHPGVRDALRFGETIERCR